MNNVISLVVKNTVTNTKIFVPKNSVNRTAMISKINVMSFVPINKIVIYVASIAVLSVLQLESYVARII